MAVQDRIDDALRMWLWNNGVSNAGLAVMQDNELVGSYGYNESSAENSVPIASLSKAITAVALMSLIDDGRLRFGSRLYSVPPSFRQSTEPWSNPEWISDISIEQLLRHTSRITFDASQDLSGIPNADSSDVILVRRTLGQGLSTIPVSEFYNNINYAILGLIMHAITNESYETYCQKMALTPRGASGKIGAGTRALGAFGGWEMSAVDYAMFARAFDPRTRLLSRTAHDFIDAKANSNTPTASLGVFVVRTASGRNLFHHGSYHSAALNPDQSSSFFAMWDNGISVVVTYDQDLTDAARNALDNTLRRAAYS
ncbi:serine hydrolase [Streptomyces sp. NBC_01363]|uniref:serine hydrolase domain-containing protein n=1 Tax=Streptomyces sp. NBC_01363 TaxID=2903840 RepID=UPI00225A6539|nr:serine hydrolase domain-containing protein [Streptomyces sp. NBC_01363]MCX4734205.1 beta-lactamase family protein [Streptomyces sp. NBC_01363]